MNWSQIHIPALQTHSDLKRSRDFFVLLLLAAGLAIPRTMALLQTGQVYGHLSIPPIYDDVSYFLSGTSLLRTYYEQGMTGVLGGLGTAHSPVASLLAFGGFLLFGIKQFAPYAMNAIPLAFTFTTIVWLADLKLVESALLLLALLGLPIVDQLVTTFHPDLWLGVLTGLICMAILRGRFVHYSPLAIAGIGLMTAFAMLTKPTGSPAMVVVLLGALSLSLIFEVVGPPRSSVREVASVATRNLLLLLGIVVLVAGPYFGQNLTRIGEYIHQGLVAERGIWYVDRSPVDSALFYLKRIRDVLGWSMWPLSALFAANLAMTIRGNQLPVALRIGGLALVTFVAYLMPTVTPTKSFFFGGLFYGLALCFLAVNLRVFVSLAEARRGRRVALAILGSCVIASVVFAKDRQQRFPKEVIADANVLFAGIYPTIRAASSASQTQSMFGTVVNEALVPFPLGYEIAPHAYQFAAEQDGLALTLTGDPRMSSRAVTLLRDTATVIVLPDSARAKDNATFPLYRHLDEIIEQTRDDRRFDLARTLRTARGNVHVFTRAPIIPVMAETGWLPLEGPYPQWNLGKVRWLTFPEGELSFTSAERMTGELILSCRAAFEGISVAAFVQDAFVGESSVEVGFSDIRIPIRVDSEAPLAVRVRIRAAAGSNAAVTSAGERAMLCRDARLEVARSDDDERPGR